MELLNKLKSRKLWAAMVGVIVGVAMMFGIDPNVAETVSGAVISVVSVVTYIITEGRIDAAAVGDAAQKVQDAMNAVAAHED
ncbi:MAG TPA: hypothetical protein IAA67_03140 [Candidatus Avoscillospira stercorigallinarum]|uniref:Holin n=1 Tax=Candidatus Avoscillospira stercorigallinarum TaxID=2840708 RepID=A0A9D0Z4X9_9FIRM|nr:hypothetical protein [Candidatus Avoscillospira stercorigallinarum]